MRSLGTSGGVLLTTRSSSSSRLWNQGCHPRAPRAAASYPGRHHPTTMPPCHHHHRPHRSQPDSRPTFKPPAAPVFFIFINQSNIEVCPRDVCNSIAVITAVYLKIN